MSQGFSVEDIEVLTNPNCAEPMPCDKDTRTVNNRSRGRASEVKESEGDKREMEKEAQKIKDL